MKSMYRIEIGFCFILGGKFAKYPRLLPHKMLKGNSISNMPKKSPKPYEIHVPNSDWISLDFSRIAKYPGLPLQKCKKQVHKQNPEKAFKTL